MEINIDREFWEDFVQEAFEHIEDIEMNVLELEKDAENTDIIHTMFRAFHTIKGLSGFVEHLIIQNIAHKTETLMDFCRKGDKKVDTEVVNVILKSADYIKSMCEDIELVEDVEYVSTVDTHISYLEQMSNEVEQSLSVDSAKEPSADEQNIEDDMGFAEIVDATEDAAIATQQNVVEESADVLVEPESSIDSKEQTVVPVEVEPAKNPQLEAITPAEVESVEPATVATVETKEADAPVEVTAADEVLPASTPKVEVETPIEVAQTPPMQKKVSASTKKKSMHEEYMKVANSKIDHLVDMIGELIIHQSLIEQYVHSKYPNDNDFFTNMGGMSRTTRELQELSMFLRMVSLKPTFQKVSRVARDTIQELGKDIEFITSGDTTEIDRVVTDRLLDPLVHLIKNAISHGIEQDLSLRTNNNKPAKGKVELNAYNKRGNVYIEIKDDGAGINTDIVYNKAIEKNLIDPARDYTEEEIKEFILLPGFSTAKVIDNVSGRGVGMDVVKTEITKIGGRVDIKSELGKGTTFTLKIPVNHAIMNGTVIELNNQQFIVPTVNVKEILQPKDNHWIYTQQKRTMLRVRDNIVPIVPTSLLLKDNEETDATGLVLLLESEQEYRALPIHNVLNRQEVVVKPLGEEFVNLKYISGMSILGNGRVSLILDIDYLFTMEVKE